MEVHHYLCLRESGERREEVREEESLSILISCLWRVIDMISGECIY